MSTSEYAEGYADGVRAGSGEVWDRVWATMKDMSETPQSPSARQAIDTVRRHLEQAEADPVAVAR